MLALAGTKKDGAIFLFLAMTTSIIKNKKNTTTQKEAATVFSYTITMTSMITTDLLEALLSPDAHRRGEAEAYFQGVAPMERVGGLVPMIQHFSNHNANTNNSGVASLAAILLRRDILRLSDLPLLEAIVAPLLEAFLVSNNNTSSSSMALRTAVGHCLAEICGTVAAVSNNNNSNNQQDVMTRILSAISSPVRFLNVLSFLLVYGNEMDLLRSTMAT